MHITLISAAITKYYNNISHSVYSYFVNVLMPVYYVYSYNKICIAFRNNICLSVRNIHIKIKVISYMYY